MNYDTLIHSIVQFGYAALFFALWLGIVGMPIPDEVIVMTGGAVSVAGLLNPLIAFIVIYIGVVSGLSLGYFLGRCFGSPILVKIRQKQKLDKHIKTAEKLINKHGNSALSFSYFIPVIRHIVPYLVGITKMSFRIYAVYSYTAGFVWTLIFFIAGKYAGAHVEKVGTLIYHYGIFIGSALVIAVILVFIIRKAKGNM
ncbi:Inner membrane protein YohD [compost metagenome]